jgi:hypothetical protein
MTRTSGTPKAGVLGVADGVGAYAESGMDARLPLRAARAGLWRDGRVRCAEGVDGIDPIALRQRFGVAVHRRHRFRCAP